MATSLDGHILKTTSTPLNRLITEGYNPDENTVWDLVNVGFLLGKLSTLQNGVDADLLALFTLLSDAMGIKLIPQNVSLTGLFVFPNLPTYTPKPKERVLLIAQNTPAENGLYEWHSGTLTRLYDWRDVEQGTGIKITGKNLSVNLLNNAANLLQVNTNNELQLLISPNSHPALKKEVGTGDLFLDPAELTGGGGATLLDVPHPDIHSVVGDNVLIASDTGTLEINGGNFRRDASVICEGFEILEFNTRRSNRITISVQATNLIGIHDVLVKHLVLDSADTGKQKFTVVGAAVIDTVTPFAKRGQTINMTVTGVGFALLSAFAANNAGITIALVNVIDRFNVVVAVTCDNTVSSGNYNLVCTNALGGNTFDSGTSGDNKLIVSGAPLIAALLEQIGATLQRPEVGDGQTATFTLKGFDFDNTAVNLMSVVVEKTNYALIDNETYSIEVVGNGNSNPSVYGLYDIKVINLTTGEDSGTSGNQIIGLNYTHDRFYNFTPTQIRPYGGTLDTNDWTLATNANGTNIEKVGGSGWCYFEFTDYWFAKSVIDNSYGALLSFLEANIATLAQDLGEEGEVFVALAPAGLNLTVTDLPTTVSAAYIKFEKNKDTQYPITHYAVEYKGVFQPNGYGYYIGDYQKFALHLKASDSFYNQTDIRPKAGFSATQYNPDDSNWFPIWASQSLPNGAVVFGSSNNPKLAVYVGMNGNFAISNLRLRGRVGY